MTFEEQYQEVLMNIELAVLTVYRQHPGLLDFQVDDALGALMSRFKAEEQGKEVRAPRVKGEALLVFEAVQVNCELMLGRSQRVMDTLSVQELLACLGRVRKSVRFWSKERGSRGYLTFVSSMLDPSSL